MTNAARSRVETWLRKRIQVSCARKVTAGVGGLLLGCGILFVIHWGVVLFCYLGLSQLGLQPMYFHLIAIGFIAVLFLGEAWSHPSDLSQITVTTGTFSDEVVVVGGLSNVNPYAPDTVHAKITGSLEILYTGPRAIRGGWGYLRDGYRLSLIDVGACSRVIDYLYHRRHRVAFNEIVKDLPGLNPVETLPQVTQIEGVLVLTSDPPGLTLSFDLRASIDEAL